MIYPVYPIIVRVICSVKPTAYLAYQVDIILSNLPHSCKTSRRIKKWSANQSLYKSDSRPIVQERKYFNELSEEVRLVSDQDYLSILEILLSLSILFPYEYMLVQFCTLYKGNLTQSVVYGSDNLLFQ